MTPRVIQRLFHKGFNADVWLTVAGDERKLPAHRFILTARSDYFKTLLSDSAKPETDTICVCSSQSMSYEMLEKVIRFMYTSEIEGQLTHEEFKEFHAATKSFRVFSLPQLKVQVKSICKVDTALEIYSLLRNEIFVWESNHHVRDYITENLAKIIDDNSFLDTSVNVLEDIFGSFRLKIDSEEGVFKAIVKWINNDFAERSQYFPRLLKCVRFDPKDKMPIDFVVTEMLKWCDCRESKLHVIHILTLMEDPKYKLEGCNVNTTLRSTLFNFKL